MRFGWHFYLPFTLKQIGVGGCQSRHARTVPLNSGTVDTVDTVRDTVDTVDTLLACDGRCFGLSVTESIQTRRSAKPTRNQSFSGRRRCLILMQADGKGAKMVGNLLSYTSRSSLTSEHCSWLEHQRALVVTGVAPTVAMIRSDGI